MRTLVLLTLVLLPIAGCLDEEGQGPPERVDVRLVEYEFQPTNATANATVPVRFINEGDERHTVTIVDPDDGSRYLLDTDDPGLGPGNFVEYAFPAPGNYTVLCRYHDVQGMRMTVLVTG